MKTRQTREIRIGNIRIGGANPIALNDLIDVDWVLFTADDRMPFEHPEAIASVGIAVATVDPRRTDGYGINEWRHEIVHRWAHIAQEQPRGLIRRYSLNSYRV